MDPNSPKSPTDADAKSVPPAVTANEETLSPNPVPTPAPTSDSSMVRQAFQRGSVDTDQTHDSEETLIHPRVGSGSSVRLQIIADAEELTPDKTLISPSQDQSSETAIVMPDRIGRYQVRGLLGKGGMGLVFRAFDPMLEREVAIKQLSSQFLEDADALRRFMSEARSAARISHPHAAAIYEIGQEGNSHFIVMELLTGGTLDRRLHQLGRIPWPEATHLLAQACSGLLAVHAAGVIHRDVKPSNIMLTQDGQAKLTDFGLSKFVESESLTAVGSVLGTPHYMSPEQCRSDKLDARSDLYSLGATYYTLLTGVKPFHEARTPLQVMFAHCNKSPADASSIQKDIPEACVEILRRALQKDPNLRYQSAQEFLDDLELLLNDSLPRRKSVPRYSQVGTKSDWLSSPAPTGAAPPANWSRRALLMGTGALASGFLLAAGIKSWWPRGPQVDANAPKIRVGILHSLSGTMRDSETPVIDATLFAIDELNRQGGLLGRRIEPLIVDGRSDWQTFAKEAEHLITQEKVCVLFGCWTSASRKTVLPVLEKHRHLLFYPVQYEGLEQSPYVVYTGAAPNQQIMPALRYFWAYKDKRRFFLVGSDYVFPRAANEIMRDLTHSLTGAEIVGEEYIPLGEVEIGPVIEKIIQAKPDLILNTINGDSNVAFFRELRSRGIMPDQLPTVSFSIGEQELLSLKISDMVGDYAAWNYFQSLETPENQAFVKKFKSQYGPRRVVTDPMESAFLGVNIWAQAVRQTKSVEPEEVRLAIRGQRFNAPEGPVMIDSNNQHTHKKYRIGQIQSDGLFRIIESSGETISPEPYPKSRTPEQWQEMLNDLYQQWGGNWAKPTP